MGLLARLAGRPIPTYRFGVKIDCRRFDGAERSLRGVLQSSMVCVVYSSLPWHQASGACVYSSLPWHPTSGACVVYSSLPWHQASGIAHGCCPRKNTPVCDSKHIDLLLYLLYIQQTPLTPDKFVQEGGQKCPGCLPYPIFLNGEISTL
jgi:hypothetical protein